MSTESSIESIYTQIRKTIQTKNVSVTDLIGITANAILLVELTKFEGGIKKDIVINVITRIANEFIPNSEEAQMQIYLQYTLSKLIDAAINVSNHIKTGKLSLFCCKK